MKDKITAAFRKKVRLSDVASPKPSRAATRVINDSLKRAYRDQRNVSQKAHNLRSNR